MLPLTPTCSMANFSNRELLYAVPQIGGTNEHTHIPVGSFSTCSSVRQSSVVFPHLSVFTYLIEKYSLNSLPCCLVGNLSSYWGTPGE